MKNFRLVQLKEKGESMLKRFLDRENYSDVGDNTHLGAVKTIVPILIEQENLSFLQSMSKSDNTFLELVILCTDEIGLPEMFFVKVCIQDGSYNITPASEGMNDV